MRSPAELIGKMEEEATGRVAAFLAVGLGRETHFVGLENLGHAGNLAKLENLAREGGCPFGLIRVEDRPDGSLLVRLEPLEEFGGDRLAEVALWRVVERFRKIWQADGMAVSVRWDTLN